MNALLTYCILISPFICMISFAIRLLVNLVVVSFSIRSSGRRGQKTVFTGN